MASNTPLEDMVTCPICQDLFAEPLALRCLHTLCSKCVFNLRKSTNNKQQIECPICREQSKVKLIVHVYI